MGSVHPRSSQKPEITHKYLHILLPVLLENNLLSGAQLVTFRTPILASMINAINNLLVAPQRPFNETDNLRPRCPAQDSVEIPDPSPTRANARTAEPNPLHPRPTG